jgi:hypothetical protein
MLAMCSNCPTYKIGPTPGSQVLTLLSLHHCPYVFKETHHSLTDMAGSTTRQQPLPEQQALLLSRHTLGQHTRNERLVPTFKFSPYLRYHTSSSPCTCDCMDQGTQFIIKQWQCSLPHLLPCVITILPYLHTPRLKYHQPHNQQHPVFVQTTGAAQSMALCPE